MMTKQTTTRRTQALKETNRFTQLGLGIHAHTQGGHDYIWSYVIHGTKALGLGIHAHTQGGHALSVLRSPGETFH